MKREFILAMTIFVMMAVVGTGFGLWFLLSYGPDMSQPAPVAKPV